VPHFGRMRGHENKLRISHDKTRLRDSTSTQYRDEERGTNWSLHGWNARCFQWWTYSWTNSQFVRNEISWESNLTWQISKGEFFYEVNWDILKNFGGKWRNQNFLAKSTRILIEITDRILADIISLGKIRILIGFTRNIVSIRILINLTRKFWFVHYKMAEKFLLVESL